MKPAGPDGRKWPHAIGAYSASGSIVAVEKYGL